MLATANQNFLRQVLLTEFARRRDRNPAYSARAFAAALKLNSGALSGILHGKRRVSARLALGLAERLSLDPEQRARLAAPAVESAQAPALSYDALDMKNFSLISEAAYFAMLSLAKKSGVRNDPEFLASRLCVPVQKARAIVATLLELGMIEERKGKLLRTGRRLSTSDGIASAAIRRAHFEDCELARRSLEQDSIEQRDFSSITFRLDPAALKQIAEIVRQAQDRVLDLSEAADGEEVYRLSVHVFPLTNVSQKEKK